MSVRRLSGVIIGVLVLLAGVGTVLAGQTVGAKIWQAEWEVSDSGFSDSDSAIMYILQYNYNMPESKTDISAQVGWGDGWTLDNTSADRTDVLLSLSRRSGYFQYGVGYHYIGQGQTFAGVGDWTGTYHGPELLLGAFYPLPGGFGIVVSGQYIPILFWKGEDSIDNITNEGETDAFGYDISVNKSYESWRVAIGYRAQHIDGDRGDANKDTWIIDDDFSGVYLSAGIVLGK